MFSPASADANTTPPAKSVSLGDLFATEELQRIQDAFALSMARPTTRPNAAQKAG